MYLPTQGSCVRSGEGEGERKRRRHLLTWSHYERRLVTFCLHCPHIIQFLLLILPSKHVQLVSQEGGGVVGRGRRGEEERKRGRGRGRSGRRRGRSERKVREWGGRGQYWWFSDLVIEEDSGVGIPRQGVQVCFHGNHTPGERLCNVETSLNTLPNPTPPPPTHTHTHTHTQTH